MDEQMKQIGNVGFYYYSAEHERRESAAATDERVAQLTARPFLSSVRPDLTDGAKVIFALCKDCGTVRAFNVWDNSKFPDTGYWTECRACAEWRYFFRIHDGRIVNHSKGNEAPGGRSEEPPPESAAQEPQMPTKQDYDIQGPFAIPFVKQPTPAEDVAFATQKLVTKAEWDMAVDINSDTDVTDYRGVCESLIQSKLAKAREGWVPQSEIKPKCPDCNSVRMGHCSDPEHCGSVYWPDHMYRKLEQQLAGTVTLEAAEEAVRAVVIGWVGAKNLERVWNDIRSRLTQQEPTERVTIKNHEGALLPWEVLLDGKSTKCRFEDKINAERYAVGLRDEILTALKGGK